ncbi:hypothetical protein CKO28_23450 [Rhodovibrio sodomensis]|uniref:KfrA N-terminal DNA-binding domain-containing protein n=1 Tax=Rhodovibrio sodomensis TaxID=1088 RepID=A0ABS1DLS9_9PROT|nr:hypothetical protein [Rhodovibrio sodomensis]MBK1670971.1 hypothetical protein [Rhodovibrio sodomensis]
MSQQSDPASIIRYALEESRGRGLDSLGQINHAVRRVLALRPDMGRSRAESLVQEAIWPRPSRPPRAVPAAMAAPRRRPPSVLRSGSGD